MKQRGLQLKERLILALWNRTPVLLKQEHDLAPRGTSFNILGLNRGILWRHQSWRKSTLNIHWKDWWSSWSSNTLATWCEAPTHWKKPWCWERLKAKREKGNRGWDGWVASPTQWTWVWANSRRRWRAGEPGVLQSTGWQRVRRDLVTE